MFIFFILREGEREKRECMGERQRERERESRAGSMLSVQSPMQGLIPWTMRSLSELKSRIRYLAK